MLIPLPLFLFRPNRSSLAWRIWLPVGFTASAGIALVFLLADQDRNLSQAVCSFIIGLAAVWLLMPYLKGRHRIGTFFKTLPVLAGFSLLAFVPALLVDDGGWIDVPPYLAALLALASLVATLALVFTGRSVRRRFGRIRFVVWLAVWVVLAWTAIATPFAIAASLESGRHWGEFVSGILLSSGIMLAMLLPLVLLSFFQPFYRARFFSLLNLPQPDPSAGASVPPRIPDVHQSR
jgi:peptidoglycan/LPS O-acetylase OafA/YrhL